VVQLVARVGTTTCGVNRETKVRFAGWNVSGIGTQPSKLAMPSSILQREKIDACVIGETKLADGLKLDTLRDSGWHTLVKKRENTHNGGVALLVSPEWTAEEIDTQHEDPHTCY
jgi:exonuclease III